MYKIFLFEQYNMIHENANITVRNKDKLWDTPVNILDTLSIAAHIFY